MPTATVTLNITTFNPAPMPCVISRPVIQPGGGGNRVKYKSPDTPTDYTIIAMKKGQASLDIAFDVPGYTPGPGASPATFTGADGPANFTTQSVSGSTVTVTDVFANVGNGTNNPSWKYSIAVVNSQGVQGIIDPGIENEN